MTTTTTRKAHYNYAPDRGCGSPRCNNGWVTWSGSEYPCSTCKEIDKQRATDKATAISSTCNACSSSNVTPLAVEDVRASASHICKDCGNWTNVQTANTFLQSCLQAGDVARLRAAARLLASPIGCNPDRDSALAVAYVTIADHIEATQ